MASNHIFQREESSDDFNDQVYQLKGVSDTDNSSSDRSDDDSDISVSEINSEDKDDIEKAKKILSARVRVQVSTSLMLPVYSY